MTSDTIIDTEIRFKASEFDPDTVFTSGQTFRFSKEDDGIWHGIAYDSAVQVVRDGDTVELRARGPHDETLWRTYTDAGTDYSLLFPEADEVLRAAIVHGCGLRVLHQDPFETLISFIISANNNIARISGIVGRLCDMAGTEIADGGHAFPSADAIHALTEEDLRKIGAGYRAPYILKSAERARDTDFAHLETLGYDELRNELLKFSGVGPKVADCIALFGFGKVGAFPVDVWVRRIMKQLYGEDGTPAQIRRRAEERFGPAAGIAQQYLFHYARAVLERGT